MKKLRYISWILCFALAFQLFVSPVRAEDVTDTTAGTTAPTEQTEPVDVSVPQTPEDVGDYTGQDASITAGSRTIEAGSSLHGDGKLLETAEAAILYEVTSGSMVYSFNPDMKIEPASFAKIMTALLAIEHGNMDDVVTVKQSVLDTVGSPDADIVWELVDGEQMPLIDLFYCMLTVSSNNAAAVIADHIAGSQEAFVGMMNQRARELGCTNTNFTNPHGIQEEGMYSTCRDIVRIIMAAMEHETFRVAFSDDYYYVEVTNLNDYRGLYSRNYMLGMLITDVYYDDRVTGGRTASTSAGRSSLASTFEAGDLSYISIVYGAESEDLDEWGEVYGTHHVFLETQELIDIGCEGYSIKQVLRPGQITSHFAVNNGGNDVVAGPTTEIVTLIPNGVTLDDLALRYQKTNGVLDAPVEKGEIIDTMTVWYGNVCIAQSEIVTMNSAKVAFSADDGSQNGGDGIGVGLTVFLVIVGLIVGAAGVLYLIRFVRTGLYRSRRRRRRASRRRT